MLYQAENTKKHGCRGKMVEVKYIQTALQYYYKYMLSQVTKDSMWSDGTDIFSLNILGSMTANLKLHKNLDKCYVIQAHNSPLNTTTIKKIFLFVNS